MRDMIGNRDAGSEKKKKEEVAAEKAFVWELSREERLQRILKSMKQELRSTGPRSPISVAATPEDVNIVMEAINRFNALQGILKARLQIGFTIT